MKSLVLCRHAKSTWRYHTDDIYRPLNKRGIVEAPLMAQGSSGNAPDRLLCSPAVRAFSTALSYIRENQWPLEKLKLMDAIYEADADTLLQVLKEEGESHQTVWLFGHNPGLVELLEYLSQADVENIVTGGRVQLDLNIAQWADISKGCARIVDFAIPKDMDE